MFAIKPVSPKANKDTPEKDEEKVEPEVIPLKDMDESTKVREFLTYRKNEIKVVCKFQTLLELFQEQVTQKAKELEEAYAQEQKE